MSWSGSLLAERYRLDAEIGQGGMGVVFRAHDVLLDREVAIKLLNNPAYAGQGKLRLMREAQAAARLHHPCIVTVYNVGEENGHPYIVMEYVDGVPLQIQGRRSIPEILEIMRQLCQALEHAHGMGIVHRDLKPENILITPASSIKLTDFGLARSTLSPRITMEGSILGTPVYLSPEQIMGREVDQRADLY